MLSQGYKHAEVQRQFYTNQKYNIMLFYTSRNEVKNCTKIIKLSYRTEKKKKSLDDVKIYCTNSKNKNK